MSQNKMKDVLTKFEETRPQHGGVIVDASPYLEMSDSALQRALFRAKKEGWEGHFTTTRKKADFSTENNTVTQVTAQVSGIGIAYSEDPTPGFYPTVVERTVHLSETS